MTPTRARAIAREAYVYGFPVVDNYRIQYAYFVDREDKEYKAPWNTLYNNARVYTSEDTAIQAPNSDTPYSYAGADLRAEPLVLHVPSVEQRRYYSVQFVDWYTHNFAYVGTRSTGNGAGSYLLAGPDWNGEQPAGIDGVMRCETSFAFLLIRTQLFDAADLEKVKQVQAGYELEPLSSFLGTSPPAPAPEVTFPRPPSARDERTSLEFFPILGFALQFCPVHPSERELRQRFGELGFDPASFSAEIRRAIEEGMGDAWQAYKAAEERKLRGEIGNADIFGTREHLKNNYLHRMVAAADGIYGNSKQEAAYAGWHTDSAGGKLDGSSGSYRVRFPSGGMPPVEAFWSLTMYRLPERLLVANPLQRYLINSSMLPDLVRDADGGLTFHVQRDSPGKDRESNWLPAPDGPFMVALRMYGPEPAAHDGSWKLPAMERSSK
jgi:hypothetical protein